MRKLILAAAVTAMSLGTIGAAVADDWVADPPGENGRCQEVGADQAGDNDDNGLGVASTVTDVIRPLTDDDGDDCDNSGGRRP